MKFDLEQARRSLRVLELLDESAQAYEAGDKARAAELYNAAGAIDLDALSIIYGGMLTGEIPRPDKQPEEWAKYLNLARAELLEAEGE